MRNEKGQFMKGYGFWTGKKRPGLKTSTSFTVGQIPWNKGRRKHETPKCLYCNEPFEINRGTITKPHQVFCSRLCRAASTRGANYGRNVTKTYAYQAWRRTVLDRDKVCVMCGSDQELQVDHIKPKRLFPELMHDINNGRVLCFSCHRLTPTYGGRALVI